MKADREVALTFENDGKMSHNLHIPELGVKTDTIGPGKTVTVRFKPEKTGTFQFVCEVPGHKQAGMKGQIKVQ